MIRHAANQNLTLHYERTYLGLRIQDDKAPLIREYLSRLHETVTRALRQYPRVFAFRLDLHFPSDQCHHGFGFGNEIINRFFDSFKAKLRHNRHMAKRKNKYAHDTVVRYVWTRETGQRGRPHYHMVIFLNYDAFCALGRFVQGRDNIFNRLQEAWASALNVSLDAATGLVHIPEDPWYHIYRDNDESFARFFYRASYLCKAATKVFGDGCHGFGASRL